MRNVSIGLITLLCTVSILFADGFNIKLINSNPGRLNIASLSYKLVGGSAAYSQKTDYSVFSSGTLGFEYNKTIKSNVDIAIGTRRVRVNSVDAFSVVTATGVHERVSYKTGINQELNFYPIHVVSKFYNKDRSSFVGVGLNSCYVLNQGELVFDDDIKFLGGEIGGTFVAGKMLTDNLGMELSYSMYNLTAKISTDKVVAINPSDFTVNAWLEDLAVAVVYYF